MPIKGTAFEKPGVNAAHKAAVREQARLRAAAHETADDDLLNDLQAYIAASALSASRKAGWWLDQLLEMYRKETMPMMLDLEPRGQ